LIPEPIRAGSLTLRAWQPEEAELYVSGRDETIFEFTTESPGLDRDSCADDIRRRRHDPNLAPFAVCDDQGRPLGTIEVRRVGDEAELSYWLMGSARGRGYGKAALLAASEWAEQAWGARILTLEIRPDNEASIRTARAAGFTRSGTRLNSACGGPALLYRRRRDREMTV
jgi:ribosomal-protein-alanine N-acetyltransferase